MSDLLLDEVPIPVPERLALNATVSLEGRRILCTTSGRAQCAAALAQRLSASSVTCHFFDIYQLQQTEELGTVEIPNLRLTCAADLPPGEVDLVVVPVSKAGESELTRDILQQGFDRLAIGGTLVATVDNPKDKWLHHELEKLGRNLNRTPKRSGIVFRLKKLKPISRLRDFSTEVVFRDGERLVPLITRPGVFSHRKFDTGARALIEVMQVHPGDRILDIGCGSGGVGIAAALRAPETSLHAIDSNVRAIECAKEGARRNEIERFSTTLTAEGDLEFEGSDLSGQFDLALGNPPYFSHFAIAEIFLQTALRALKPQGRVAIVTKHEEWLVARMEQLFDDVSPHEVRGYTVVTGVQKSPASAS